MQETKHQFVLASFRNISNKKGDAAYAAAYLVGQLYMAELKDWKSRCGINSRKISAAFVIRPMRSTTRGNTPRPSMLK